MSSSLSSGISEANINKDLIESGLQGTMDQCDIDYSKIVKEGMTGGTRGETRLTLFCYSFY